MDKRAYKDAIYTELSRIGKAISSPKRLEILDLLCQRAWTVDELATETHISMANASQHLQVLRAAQLVVTAKRGLFVEYRVTDEFVCTLCHGIRTLAERQIAELERITARFIDGREGFVSIDRETLLSGMDDGSITLVDVRPESEYRSGHLRGAISIPVDDLPERIRDLPRDGRIVAYCRGPYCLYASDAVRMLQGEGYNAVRYEEGVTDWKAAGLPIGMVMDPAGESSESFTRPDIAKSRRSTRPPDHTATTQTMMAEKKTRRKKS